MATESKVYSFNQIQVFFKHTDQHGFIHPYNFLEWTSYVREAFFQEKVPNFLELTDGRIKMMTTRITCDLFLDCMFGDKLEAHITFEKIRHYSFNVKTTFLNLRLSKVVCATEHTLVFVDSERGKFASIPTELLQPVLEHSKDVKKSYHN
ncbi:MAG: hypothetical protein COV74_00305 [Candidatus Omnitrophica bacterium CG11_big_fil_rev_8_21_14_0_20_45_26]|uniref:Thioesterase n=1 Tax=Candidatus Abzuiibacterium crystallinum TaxID=1974748 RepID=A0A2H0LT17_9BACT|nr:MAG: hypothetical protein COV74_00305 [Candidatus Omnitrophica bacterium CG11_big_fil_rev_8_21_14_0_20_45_26]PIW64620.1 MAG: hypothetical protein COW12_05475 [Candidatus Omnitrophica bacterium CG12_big_fil_rev_8_21_14_0_65_45_16]